MTAFDERAFHPHCDDAARQGEPDHDEGSLRHDPEHVADAFEVRRPARDLPLLVNVRGLQIDEVLVRAQEFRSDTSAVAGLARQAERMAGGEIGRLPYRVRSLRFYAFGKADFCHNIRFRRASLS